MIEYLFEYLVEVIIKPSGRGDAADGLSVLESVSSIDDDCLDQLPENRMSNNMGQSE